MKCEFSETQFAFCFTFEILQRYPQLKAPWFPTLREEGKPGGGYDVAIVYEDFGEYITGSLFLQFKRPTFLVKNEGKYQIEIKTGKKQFKMLKTLAKDKPANLVYYSAPKFHTRADMENFYLNKKVETNSALFLIKNFPDDEDYHKLVYEYKGDYKNGEPISTSDLEGYVQNPYGLLSSDPKKIETSPSIFSNSYTRDRMTLQEKAKFLLRAIGHSSEPQKPVETLFSTLLIKYNILWIPIMEVS